MALSVYKDITSVSPRLLDLFTMVLWSLLILLTAIACIGLFFAGRSRAINVGEDVEIKVRKQHLRRLHDEIDVDLLAGRISAPDAEAAKGELAREYLRTQEMGEHITSKSVSPVAWVIPFALVAIVIASFGVYAFLGNPNLPGMPLAERQPAALMDNRVVDAIAQVEARLVDYPEDVRGWQVLAPIYMRANRFDDAAKAYRRILELSPLTADMETDLAEALMMANNGLLSGEPLALLQSAAARDAQHVRSRFYLAGDATQNEDFDRAVKLWEDLLTLANGDEPWVPTAQRGLAIAQAGANGGAVTPLPEAAEQRDMIEGMVAGLSERLLADGGTLEEWTRLVRSQLVLGQITAAQTAYDKAKLAYPDATRRQELDKLATQNNLK